MNNDPAIEDIRRTRREISKRFGHDTKALIAHYEKLQKKYADRLVAAPSTVYVPSGADNGSTSRSA
ncbi:MAG TPA: hypothetical protein HPP83_00655 [Candidatus Hydrogenedentes bacterium]|nr:hypothetical protein [Candidatus Hydrogenedentota bacterium]